MRRRILPIALPAAALVLSVAYLATAQSSRLHEYVPPDPAEDLRLNATTLDGELPAAIETPSGIATAPSPAETNTPDRVYSGVTTDDGPESTYEPDRDTRRPNIESYDDPFSPATAPFKRLRAYDAVKEDYTLYVANRTLEVVPIGGRVEAGEEPFYGDLSVDILPNQEVRIPSVGPGTRILKLHTTPARDVSVLRDGADNWFIRGQQNERVRLVLELSIPRDTFGSPFPDVSWSELAPYVGSQPAAHREPFEEVAAAIGISKSMRPADALEKLVFYFRSFEASDDPPRSRDDIYLDLALTQKGVCRHRSFAFLVTALQLGLPSRMVVNEAHAWVEVYDGDLWHRIDLGGAALNLEHQPDPTQPPHQPPPDPFSWPEGAETGSGLGLADREREGLPTDPNAPSQNGPSDPSDTATPPTPPAPTAPPANPGDPEKPPSQLSLLANDEQVRRGQPIQVSGTVKSPTGPCARLRVDLVIVGETAAPVVLGSLSTDQQGRYDGAVVIPRDVVPGSYELVARTAGDTSCAAGSSE